MDDPTTDGVTEGFGLMFYNARWYDPQLGRFAQADTVVAGENYSGAQSTQDVARIMYTALTVNYSERLMNAKHNADNVFIQKHGGSLINVDDEEKRKAGVVGVPLESQVFDRYSYVQNNPVKYIDPTGHDTYGGTDTFGYYETDDGILTIRYQKQTRTYDINKVDQNTLSKLMDFKRDADNFKNAQGDWYYDLFGLGAGIVTTVVGITMIPPGCTLGTVMTAGIACAGSLALTGIGISGVLAAGGKLIKDTEGIYDYQDQAEEILKFLDNNIP